MFMLHNGISYVHINGKVWIDRSTYVDASDWFAASDKSDLLWQAFNGWKPYGM